MVIVIIREDLITDDVLPGTPTMLTYKTHMQMQNHSTIHRRHMESISAEKYSSGSSPRAALAAMKERNEKKAKVLYDFLGSE